MKIYFFLIGLMFPFVVHSTDYYVSNSGNDNNPGTSVTKPFKSIDRINRIKLKPGDKVLFRRGDVFPGELVLNYSGTEKKPIIISSYGEQKNKPEITGAVPVSNWNSKGKNLYSAEVPDDVKLLFNDKEYLNLARSPDTGFYFIENGDSISLSEKDLAGMPELIDATVRIQTVNWQWEIRKVTQHSNRMIKFDSVLWHSAQPDFGYYLENLPSFMNQMGEWYYNPNDKELSIIWDEDFSNEVFYATIFDNAIRIKKGLKNVIIEDLSFTKFYESAITAGAFCENIQIKNNHFSNIEVFGIYADTAANNWTISHNEIGDVLGRGISLLEPQNCKIIENRIKRIGMIAGHGFDGVNSGTAICVENNERRSPEYKRIAMHNSISNNRIDSTGYGAIRADGAYNIIEYNVVRDAVLTMNDGGGIYCWGNTYDYTHNSVFRKNIVVNVHGNMTSCAGNHKIITCLYMDNYSNNCLIEDNIFVGAQTGIILNDLSHSHNVRNNIIYNVDKGISISIWRRSADSIRGNFEIKQNTIYPLGEDARAIQLGNHLNLDFPLGTIDSNLYVSPASPMIMQRFNVFDKKKVTNDYELESWIKDMEVDQDSRAIVPVQGDKWWQMEDDSFILINDTWQTKKFDIGEEAYQDIAGSIISGQIEMEPFTARIFYRK